MAEGEHNQRHFAVGSVAKRRPFRVVMYGESNVVMVLQDLSIDRVIDAIQSRRIPVPPGLRSYSVTDESTGEKRSVG